MRQRLHVSERNYKTPLPSTSDERVLWKLVIELYAYTSAAQLPSSSSSPFREREVAATTTTTTTRDTTAALREVSTASSSSTTPLMNDGPLGHRHHNRSSSFFESVHAEPGTESLGSPLSYASNGASPVAVDAHAVAASLVPLASYLTALGHKLGRSVEAVGGSIALVSGSVIDVAVQLPLPALRLEAVRLLLSFPCWQFHFCAPVAVAARVGDVRVLELLLSDERIDVNAGFPLVVAVRARQNAVLHRLVRDKRIRLNYGSPFFEAVTRADMEAMAVLGVHPGVRVNRFVDNRGTTPLLYVLRQLAKERVHENNQCDEEDPTPTMARKQQVCFGASYNNNSNNNYNNSNYNNNINKAALPLPGGGSAVLSNNTSMVQRSQHPRSHSEGAGVYSSSECASPTTSVVTAAHHHHHNKNNSSKQQHHEQCGWLRVLLFILRLPSVDINGGYYASPLQIAVRAGCEDAVFFLLKQPKLKPNHLPRADRALLLQQRHHVQQRGARFHSAVAQCVIEDAVAPPLSTACSLGHLRIFDMLLSDWRVDVPADLLEELEGDPLQLSAVPFMEAIYARRERWESWRWRWRRRCLVATALGSTVLAITNIWLMFGCWSAHSGAGIALIVFYPLSTVLTIAVYAFMGYQDKKKFAAKVSYQQQQHQQQQLTDLNYVDSTSVNGCLRKFADVDVVPIPTGGGGSVVGGMSRHGGESSTSLCLSSSRAAFVQLTEKLIAVRQDHRQLLPLLARWVVLIIPAMFPFADMWAAWRVHKPHRRHRHHYQSPSQRNTNGEINFTNIMQSNPQQLGSSLQPTSTTTGAPSAAAAAAGNYYYHSANTTNNNSMAGAGGGGIDDDDEDVIIGGPPSSATTGGSSNARPLGAVNDDAAGGYGMGADIGSDTNTLYYREDLSVRSLAYASYTLLIPSRLLMTCVSFFIHLAVLFPDGPSHAAVAAVCVAHVWIGALGMTAVLVTGCALLAMCLALRRTPVSLLFTSSLSSSSAQRRRGGGSGSL